MTRAADLQERTGQHRTGTGQDGYGVVCAPQPFETVTETKALWTRTMSGKPADHLVQCLNDLMPTDAGIAGSQVVDVEIWAESIRCYAMINRMD